MLDALDEMYFAAFGDYPMVGTTYAQDLEAVDEHYRTLEAQSRCRRIQLEVIHAFVTSSKAGRDLSDQALASEILTRMGQRHMELVRRRKQSNRRLEQLRTLHYQMFNEATFASTDSDLTLELSRAIRNIKGDDDIVISLARLEAIDEILRQTYQAMSDQPVPEHIYDVTRGVIDGIRQITERARAAESGSAKAAKRMQEQYELAREVYALYSPFRDTTGWSTRDRLTDMRDRMLAESIGAGCTLSAVADNALERANYERVA